MRIRTRLADADAGLRSRPRIARTIWNFWKACYSREPFFFSAWKILETLSDCVFVKTYEGHKQVYGGELVSSRKRGCAVVGAVQIGEFIRPGRRHFARAENLFLSLCNLFLKLLFFKLPGVNVTLTSEPAQTKKEVHTKGNSKIYQGFRNLICIGPVF